MLLSFVIINSRLNIGFEWAILSLLSMSFFPLFFSLFKFCTILHQISVSIFVSVFICVCKIHHAIKSAYLNLKPATTAPPQNRRAQFRDALCVRYAIFKLTLRIFLFIFIGEERRNVHSRSLFFFVCCCFKLKPIPDIIFFLFCYNNIN